MARIFLNHVKFGAVQLLTAKYHYFSTLIEINVPGLVLKIKNKLSYAFFYVGTESHTMQHSNT